MVGRALVPVHERCRAPYAAAQPWHARPGLPVNRWGSLVAFTAVVGAVVAVLALAFGPPARGWRGLGTIAAVAVGWQLVARLVSWRTVERHVSPARERMRA